MRIAVIDSGVHAGHPHIDASLIDPGFAVSREGEITRGGDATLDRLGHGTAVTAAIQQWAGEARIMPVRVFGDALRASPRALARAIAECAASGADLVNLSLGTLNAAHRDILAEIASQALAGGTVLVAAQDVDAAPCFPGSLPGVLGVGLDWEVPRHCCRLPNAGEAGALYASGHPRPIDGAAQRRNLHGVSFAVANVTGFAARFLSCRAERGEAALHLLREGLATQTA